MNNLTSSSNPSSPVTYSDNGGSPEVETSEEEPIEEIANHESEEDNDDESDDDDFDDVDNDNDEGEQPDQLQNTNDPNNSTSRKSLFPKDYRHLRIRATSDLPLLSNPSLSGTVREIGKSAHWSLSTSKPGNGVDQLRDSSIETYWQSDGLQPHYINIQFPRRQTVCAIALYMDFNLDESYTPKRIKVRVGTTFHNLEEVRIVEVREPCGWCTIPLWRKWGEDVLDSILDTEVGGEEDEEDDNDDERNQIKRKEKKCHVPIWKRKPVRTHFVQIGIISMHQNGRDTHVRQVKIFGPRSDGNGGVGESKGDSFGIIGGRYGVTGTETCSVGLNIKDERGALMMMGTSDLNLPSFQTLQMSQFSTIR